MGLPIAGVNHIVAVASGKGGVGKSTVAMNLAVALSTQGLKVGLLDADVYGPSQPQMLGMADEKPFSEDGKIITPVIAHGVKLMSMGFLTEKDTPMIWRGPMVISALKQMLRQVNWAPLDILIVDMPPGTGDIQLSMAQEVPLSGAVIVSTPQTVALLDARKGLNMFRKVNVPILGVVENMSSFICPACGHEENIFDHGGAHDTAKEFGVPFLGHIPLEKQVREFTDAGKPLITHAPDSKSAAAFRSLANNVLAQLATQASSPTGPVKIVIE
jgi:ATP-binding protein involved in chromosome partitioning